MAHFVDDKTHELLLMCGVYNSVIDDAIDALRVMHNIVIYNTAAPHVDPTTGKIMYNFSVKRCNPIMGWNGRIYITSSRVWDSNIYQAKRRAIRAAARWILAHKCKKISIKCSKNK